MKRMLMVSLLLEVTYLAGAHQHNRTLADSQPRRQRKMPQQLNCRGVFFSAIDDSGGSTAWKCLILIM